MSIIIDPFKKFVDHSALVVGATEEEVRRFTQEVKDHGLRGTCLRPEHIYIATEEFNGTSYKNSAVVAFPTEKCPTLEEMAANIRAIYIEGRDHSNLQTARLHEIDQVVEAGATDIAMIIDLEAARKNDYKTIEREVRQVRDHLPKDVLLKVIECAPYFTDEELIKISKAVIGGGADYLKTTTGFGRRVAILRDMHIFGQALVETGSDAGMKAAGGIKTPEEAAAFFGVSQVYGPRGFIIGAGSYILKPMSLEEKTSGEKPY